jgi:hypothetical protein
MTSLEIRLARECDALRTPAQHTHCGHAMIFTTLALVATSTHSFLATLLAIALVALLPDSDLDTAETP